MKATGNSYFRFLLINVVFFALIVEAGSGDTGLPIWQPEDSATPYYPGGGLWPDTALPEGGLAYIEKVLATKPEPAKSAPRVSVPTEYVVLRADPLETIQEFADIEVNDDLPALDAELLAKLFDEKPVEYLLDPQGLITEQKANDILRFLEIHASESDFPVYPIVLGKNQKIPSSFDLNEVHQRWFGESPAIMAFYHFGDPEALQLVYNQKVKDKIPATVFRKIEEMGIQEAKLADNGPDQLEKIVIEMSIQAFWLEKLMNREELTLQPEPVAQPAPPITVTAPTLAKPAPAPIVVTEPKAVQQVAPPTKSPFMIRALVFGSSFFLLLAGILLISSSFTRKRTKSAPILFPGYTPQTRLGGEYTGGSFVGISFELDRND